MSGYSVELVGSREATQGANPSLVLRYLILGTDDDVLVRALANAGSPATYDQLVKQQIHTQQEGEEWWLADVQYGTSQIGNPGSVEWSFEIGGGGSVHIDHSLETIQAYPKPGSTAPEMNQAILVRGKMGDRTVDGMDIDQTTFAWSETHHIAYDLVTTSYINKLYLLRGKVNDAAWRIFAKGEVRLISVSGSARGELTVPITFGFEASHNASNLTVGGITGIAKEGWHFLWTYHEKTEDATANELVPSPRAVYVERVLEYGDFADLELPDPWN